MSIGAPQDGCVAGLPRLRVLPLRPIAEGARRRIAATRQANRSRRSRPGCHAAAAIPGS